MEVENVVLMGFNFNKIEISNSSCYLYSESTFT